MAPPTYFLCLTRADLAHGVVLEPGDVLRYDPSNTEHPYSIHRLANVVVDQGAVLDSLMAGKLEAFGVMPASGGPSSSPRPRPALALHPRSLRDLAG